MNQKVVIGYTRVSLDEQASGEYSSLDAQRDRIRQYVSLHNPEWGEPYFLEDPGFTGRDMKRPGIQKVLELLKSNRVQAVLVARLDRLSRRRKDMYELLDLFEEKGVYFISIRERFDTSTAVGRLMLNFAIALAEFERDQIAERVVAKHQQRVSRGLLPTGSLPTGYKITPEGIKIDPVCGESVKQVFSIFIQEASFYRTACRLNETQVPTIRGKTGVWCSGTVRRIIRNEVYTGKIAYNGEYYPSDKIPVFLDKEVFETANRIAATLVTKVKREYTWHSYLSGLVQCGKCGARMYVGGAHGHGGRTYFSCPVRYRRGKSQCEGISMSVRGIEAAMVTAVKEIIRKFGKPAVKEAPAEDTTALMDEILTLKRNLESAWSDCYEEQIITTEKFQAFSRKTKSRISEIERTLAEPLPSLAEWPKNPDKIEAVWNEMADNEKKAFLAQAVTSIEAVDYGILITAPLPVGQIAVWIDRKGGNQKPQNKIIDTPV